MAAQAGKDMVIRIGDSDTSPVSFSVFAGMRKKTITVNGGVVDITTSDSERWRDLLGGAAIRSFDITGDGVFKDSAADATLYNMMVNGIARMMQFDLPNFKRVTGLFYCTQMSYTGDHDGAVTYSLQFQSSGIVSVGDI